MDISFGVKTRSGYGGVPSGNLPGSAISGTGAADWIIDGSGDLVPSGTYGAFKSYSAVSYALTLADATLVTITIIPDSAHTKFRPAPLDTNDNYQLRLQLQVAGGAPGAMARGDTVWIRDSEMSSTSIWEIRPPAPTGGSWTDPSGVGVLTVRSETVDTSVDARGPVLKHGAILHSIQFRTTNSGPIYFPLSFRDIWFSAVFAGYALRYVNTADGGWGISVYNSRFDQVAGLPAPFAEGFMLARGALEAVEAVGNRFDNMARCITVFGTPSGGMSVGTRITHNLFIDPMNDCCAIGQTTATHPGIRDVVFEDNTAFGGINAGTGAHPDFFQAQGIRTATTVSFGSCQRNIYVTNGATYGFQAYFFDDSVAGSSNTNAVISNNIACTGAVQGIWLVRFDNPQVQANTVLKNLQPTALNAQIHIPAGMGGAGGRFSYNLLSSPLNIAAQTAPITTPNTLVAQSLPGFQTALPGWADAGLTDRASVLAAYTPVAGGAAANPDGTYNGALFPPAPGETVGAWNDLSVFDPSDPTWVAAHPPAS